MSTKIEAYKFLDNLKTVLNRELPPPELMRSRIEEIVNAATNNPSQKHLTGREHAFMNAVATPLLFEALARWPGMDYERARQAFLTESFRNVPEYSLASPARRLRHPFNKALGVDGVKIYQQWRGMGKGLPLTQSCPDFAFTSPFEHPIVFEAKYFHTGSERTAQRELVKDAYQAFFYRSLPVDRTEGPRPDWDYQYSCLFAYDASPEGHLLNAWESLDGEVKSGFWDGANVYVMVLRGTGA